MLTLYQKGQIQRELEGEMKHTELFVLQYPHLLVPVMNALQSISSHIHFRDHIFKELEVKKNTR